MRGLEEGKGKLLRRENNNHMLITFSLRMHRKYTNQLRMPKPKGTALPGCCWGGHYFGGLGFFFFFSRGGVALALSGEGKILSPLLPSTRSLPPLFWLSLPVPRISCSDLQIQQSGAHPPPPPRLHPGCVCFACLLSRGTVPSAVLLRQMCSEKDERTG